MKHPDGALPQGVAASRSGAKEMEPSVNHRYHFYIVDDDRVSIRLISHQLEAAGHHVSSNTSGVVALSEIVDHPPDCVLLDIMMPEMDGLEILKRLRDETVLDQTKVVIVSGKSYEFDRKRAFSFGADGYITKPIETVKFVDSLLRVIEDRIDMAFWGVHGTLPVPGNETTRYGGNTSCVSLEFSRGRLFVFDAGTGIKKLSDHLQQTSSHLLQATIFISHPHWDHINALPFFGRFTHPETKSTSAAPPREISACSI